MPEISDDASEFPFLETIRLGSVEEFLNYLLPKNPQWDAFGSWIFRGQSDEAWGLTPRAWRPDIQQQLLRFIADAERYDNFQNHVGTTGLPVEYVRLVAAQNEAIHQFATLADELGFSLLGYSRDDIVQGHTIIYGESTVYSRNIEELPVFALAQHHGIPTELLDWSYSPLVAAYFAAREKDRKTDFAVWALLRKHTPKSRYPLRLKFYHCPTFNHHFLKAQSGVFTVMDRTRILEIFKRTGQFPTLQNYMKEYSWGSMPALERPRICLRKCTLSYNFRKELLVALEKLRITKVHLMPTLDNIGDAIWGA